MSLEKSGRHEEATEVLASSILAYDWRRVHTRDPATWTFNVLRREAENAILPRLSDFFEGEWQPQKNSERLALLGDCQFEARWRDAARLYADAFASDPSLPQRLITTGFARFPWQSATMDPFEVLCSSSRFGAAQCAAWRVANRRTTMKISTKESKSHGVCKRCDGWNPTSKLGQACTRPVRP